MGLSQAPFAQRQCRFPQRCWSLVQEEARKVLRQSIFVLRRSSLSQNQSAIVQTPDFFGLGELPTRSRDLADLAGPPEKWTGDLASVFRPKSIFMGRVKMSATVDRQATKLTHQPVEFRPTGLGPVACGTLHDLPSVDFESCRIPRATPTSGVGSFSTDC